MPHNIRELLGPLGSTLTVTQSVRAAYDVLCEQDRDHVTITDLSYRPIGVIIRADVEALRNRLPESWQAKRCSWLVVRPRWSLSANASVEETLVFFQDYGMRPIVVFDAEEVLGVLHPSTVLQWCARHRPHLVEELAFIAGDHDPRGTASR